jgi:hypothetical protein
MSNDVDILILNGNEVKAKVECEEWYNSRTVYREKEKRFFSHPVHFTRLKLSQTPHQARRNSVTNPTRTHCIQIRDPPTNRSEDESMMQIGIVWTVIVVPRAIRVGRFHFGNCLSGVSDGGGVVVYGRESNMDYVEMCVNLWVYQRGRAKAVIRDSDTVKSNGTKIGNNHNHNSPLPRKCY